MTQTRATSVWIVRCLAAVLLLTVCLFGANALATADRSAEEGSLRQRLERAIEISRRRYLSTDRHTPWQIVHGIKAFGQELQLKGGADGEFVNAVDFLCSDAKVNGRRLFVPTGNGLEPLDGPGMEGHPDQFLSALAQAGLPLEHPIAVDGRTYTVENLLDQAKSDYYRGQESSWTLIAFSAYLQRDATWTNRQGEVFRIDDLVAHEVGVDPTHAPCGGTHTLYALAYALDRYRADGGTLSGAWQRAAEKLARYCQLTRSFQNRDGHFSSDYYEGQTATRDLTEQLSTTGHTLEWLTLYLSEEELQEEWITRAVEALLGTFDRTSKQPLDCDALYHATRSLVQFHRRRFRASESPLVLHGSPELQRSTDSSPKRRGPTP